MYQGKNPTALQSQNLITEALLALMEEEPFQKITIKAVCAHAGVSRQTFYSLFENKEEVIGRRLDQLFEEYRKRFIEEKRAYTLRSLCDSIMECFQIRIMRHKGVCNIDFIRRHHLFHHK